MKSSENNKLLKNAGLKLLPAVIDVLCKTLRYEIINFESVNKLYDDNSNFVLAFWHGKMIVPWFLHRGKNFGALVSLSKDGDILSAVLNKWKYNVVRGSSHKGGKESLENMLELAQQNYSIAITPDGPTGPNEKMKAGAVIVAKKTKIPLVLAGVFVKKRFVLNSWDNFQIPKPFTKVIVKYSEPIFIDENLSFDETSEIIKNQEAQLSLLNSEAEKLC